MLTQEQLKELLHYCPETGVWTWASSRKGVRKGEQAGYTMISRGKKYRCIGVMFETHLAHRLAFLYMNGSFPEINVDHEDGNGLNNVWTNLRASTPAQNSMNHLIPRNNTSGVIVVHWYKAYSKWSASITFNGRQHKLGYFANKEDAVAARKKAEAELGFHPNHGTDRPL